MGSCDADVTWWLCGWVIVCWWGSCDGQLPTLPKLWHFPSWLTQIDTAREESNAPPLCALRTKAQYDVHLRGHPPHRDALILPSQQVREESESIVAYFGDDLKLCLMQQVSAWCGFFQLKYVMHSNNYKHIVCSGIVQSFNTLCWGYTLHYLPPDSAGELIEMNIFCSCSVLVYVHQGHALEKLHNHLTERQAFVLILSAFDHLENRALSINKHTRKASGSRMRWSIRTTRQEILIKLSQQRCSLLCWEKTTTTDWKKRQRY